MTGSQLRIPRLMGALRRHRLLPRGFLRVFALLALALAGMTSIAWADTQTTDMPAQVPAVSSDSSANPPDALFGLANGADAPIQWMRTIFLGNSTPDGETSSGLAGDGHQSGLMQTGLQALLNAYSYGMLVMGSFMLLYYLLRIIAETAHTGRVGGRPISLWGPIRTVIAIGILVPLPSGLNSGQIVVLSLASGGSALASNAWQQFVGSYIRLFSGGGFLVPSSTTDQTRFIDSLFLTYVCENAYNYKIGSDSGDYLIGPLARSDTSAKGVTQMQTFTYINPASSAYCGTVKFYVPSVVMARTPSVIAAAIGTESLALSDAMRNVQRLACTFVQHTIQGPGWDQCYAPLDMSGKATPPDQLPAVSSSDLDVVVAAYNQALQKSSSDAYNIANLELSNGVMAQDSSLGWLGAGSMFLVLRGLEESLIKATQYTPYITTPQILLQQDGLTDAQKAARDATLQSLAAAQTMVAVDAPSAVAITTPGSVRAMGAGSISPAVLQSLQSGTDDASDPGDLQDFTGRIMTSIAGHVSPDSALLSTQALPGFPLLVMQRLGWDCIKAAVAIYGIGGMTGMFSSGSISVMMLIGTLILVPGIMLAYVLPLLPLIRFLFAVFGWLLGFAEAVVAVPIFALAHLDPYGEGLLPQQTRSGYLLLLQLVLRPLLIVIGLIVAFLLVGGLFSFLNTIWWSTVVGSGEPSMLNGSSVNMNAGASIDGFSHLVYGLIYAVVSYIICNMCFKAIDYVPNHALRWIGWNTEQSAAPAAPPQTAAQATDTSARAPSVAVSAVSVGNPERIAGTVAQTLSHLPGDQYADRGLPRRPDRLDGKTLPALASARAELAHQATPLNAELAHDKPGQPPESKDKKQNPDSSEIAQGLRIQSAFLENEKPPNSADTVVKPDEHAPHSDSEAADQSDTPVTRKKLVPAGSQDPIDTADIHRE